MQTSRLSFYNFPLFSSATTTVFMHTHLLVDYISGNCHLPNQSALEHNHPVTTCSFMNSWKTYYPTFIRKTGRFVLKYSDKNIPSVRLLVFGPGDINPIAVGDSIGYRKDKQSAISNVRSFSLRSATWHPLIGSGSQLWHLSTTSLFARNSSLSLGRDGKSHEQFPIAT